MNWFEFSFDAFLIVFIVLNVINVILQTIKSIATVLCGKWIAAIVNAVTFGFYTIVVVFMTADGLGLFWKALIIGVANLIGVYAVKYFEEKNRKDKLWKVELTVRAERTDVLARQLEELAIPHNYIPNVGKWTVFNIYCNTQKESAFVKDLAIKHKAKFFVSESKRL